MHLEKEKETLLIPLYGKAIESRKKIPLLVDEKAAEIVEKIDYDFSRLKIPAKTNTMMCLRAKLFDNFVIEYLKNIDHCVVLHLGCGLDSRYNRINSPKTDWYDVDYEDVITIRREFFPETENYHLIPSSVTQPGWIEKIPANNENNLVIAEGLFMYLKEDEIKILLSSLKKRIGPYSLIFDAYSKLTARNVKHHPSMKKTGVKEFWGIDNPEKFSELNPEIKFIREILFTSNEELKKLDKGTQIAYKIAHLFPMARKAQRILVYSIEKNNPEKYFNEKFPIYCH
ncbi:MAG: class I SAM-dependent methyltransferase [Prolixibacteraceae bacterium]|nr:class I SAM-dependent methyltransferase [Prolixibacteraceae bacterium]